MPTFTFATLQDAQTALSGRLYDQTQQLWPAAELTVYIQEALRNWNALTNLWRAEFAFSLATATYWYDITNQTTAPNTLRPFTVTDNYLTQFIQYHLLEPLSAPPYPISWNGSLQFTLDQVLKALTRRQNEVLGVTGCTLTRSTPGAPILRAGIVLPDTTIDIRRVAWLPVSNTGGFVPTIMQQTDVWAKRAFDFNYLTADEAPPQTWLQSVEPPPRFDVDYIPPVNGQYDVLTVNSGNVFNATAAQLLSIPDDWSWLIKWGATFDLLSGEANAKDALRANYAQKRYAEGLKFLANASSVLALQINGVPLAVDAVTNGDRFNVGWQALAAAYPLSAYTAGLNLIVFPLSDQAYGALVSVVQNAPIPQTRADYIEVTRDDYDVILDMAQHIAMFKVGGSEFAKTLPLYQNFLARASVYNGKLRAMGPFQWSEYDISRTDEQRNPRVA